MPKPSATRQILLGLPTPAEQPDPHQPLKQPADPPPWLEREQVFGMYYSLEKVARPNRCA